MSARPGPHPLSIALMAVFAVQVAFGWQTRPIKPHWEILPPPPTERAIAFAAFGDRQFLYRVLVRRLQDAGDEGGRVTPLKDYDIGMIVAWLDMLDTLDQKAHHHIGLAMRYFSLSQREADLEPLVRFAMRHVDRDPAAKLDWLSNALLIAQNRLHDPALALEVAEQMGRYELPEAAIRPIAYMIAPILRAEAGDYAGALTGMRRAYSLTANRASPTDRADMLAFIADMEGRLRDVIQPKSDAAPTLQPSLDPP
jgi:hypothetical protein